MNNQRGIAILFVMTAITILSAILADFTYETQINKLRSYNSQDRLQAKLNAEAGLKLSLARLELYQVARNELEKNDSLKNTIKIADLNTIWNIPFIYPLIVPPKVSGVVKAAIEKFMEDALIEGEIDTSIMNISNKLNINLLRIGSPKLNLRTQTNQGSQQGQGNQQSQPRKPEDVILNLEKQLIELFRQTFDRKVEEDQGFSQKYSNVQPDLLFKEIKFYINDADRDLEPEIQEIKSQYAAKDVVAKHAPFQSKSELYLLEGWDDELLDIIMDEITVHGVAAIDLNTITEKGLRLLIPEIDDQGVKDFFEFRDDPQAPNPFNNIQEFKNYVVNTAGIMDSAAMDNRIKEFQEAGIEFGVYGSLFEVVSKGISGRSEYTITAIVEIPRKPTAPPEPQTNQGQNPPGVPPIDSDDPDADPDAQDRQRPSGNQQRPPEPPQFLKPRVVEIKIS